MLPLTYLLPIRSPTRPHEELTTYLRGISELCPVLVVDGSDREVFDATHAAWSPFAVHVAPDPRLRCRNGKVHGVLTGLQMVTTELIVIADDDVRYTAANLRDLVDVLGAADLVVPQNYFRPLPWHARWDTGRTLLNRATGGDFPGTLGVRTSVLRSTGGYDGDVLFENLELIRTVEAAGGSCRRCPGLYVRRRPPTARHFCGQRVRQAYDELARPARLAAWLSVLPLLLLSARRRSVLVAAATATIGVADAGRRTAGGRTYFPWSCSLFAPVWGVERAICVWLALLVRARGGVSYSGGRIRRAATSPRRLRQVHGGTAR